MMQTQQLGLRLGFRVRLRPGFTVRVSRVRRVMVSNYVGIVHSLVVAGRASGNMVYSSEFAAATAGWLQISNNPQ